MIYTAAMQISNNFLASLFAWRGIISTIFLGEKQYLNVLTFISLVTSENNIVFLLFYYLGFH